MSGKVLVTGIGIVSAIGFDAKSCLNSLQFQHSGIQDFEIDDTKIKNHFPLGRVKATDIELKSILGIDLSAAISRTTLIGIMAAKEALNNAGIDLINDNSANLRTGIVSATTVGGMDRGEIFYAEFIKNPSKGRLRNIIHHDCGDATEKIADYLNVKDYISTISTACSSSANSIMHAARLIKNGVIDRVVAGGVDVITNFTINGFRSLNILSTEWCKPFDNTRSGLNLGEGAGFLVLESENAVSVSKNKKVLCELKGYGNACDAYHQTASSPEGNGAWLAMNKALINSKLSANEIDYINAHGTGTINNDVSEGKAMERIFFGGRMPKFSSTKAFTGHTLGASGGIEAVFSVMAINNQMIFPNMNFSEKMHELSIEPNQDEVEGMNIRNVLSNSFGFGGNNSTLIFSKC